MSTIDPLQSLSFSIAANPGVYALLLGSGMSRSAGIPTGWDVVLDLLGKLAASDGGPGGVELEEWYWQKYGREPEYSDLLDALARTAAERQQLLRPYFEPDEDERELGLTQPTKGHQAIAQMVAHGLIRVIITTNFDQLIETALRDAGVRPTVLSTPDQVAGALPLIHTDCCVFKVHGDYLDPRILNSPAELEVYDPELDRLLDQIFDQFGLVVCGWPAEWDVALRHAVIRSPSRRFTTYWASRGELATQAQNLVEHRRAQVVQIEDADTFFQEVQATVASIVEFSRPHPLSTQAAVETLKRYLINSEYRIRLADHIDSVVRRLTDTVDATASPMSGPVNQDTFTSRLGAYESACATLTAIAVVAGRWAEAEHFEDWNRVIRQVYNRHEVSGDQVWASLRNYPAHLVIYALGLGAVASGRLGFLGRLFDITVDRRLLQRDQSAVLLGLDADMKAPNWNQLLPGKERHYTPFNDHLYDVLKEPCSQLLLDDEEYSLVFDKFEILMALSVKRHSSESLWRITLGAFLHRPRNRVQIMNEIRDSLDQWADASPYVECGVIGPSADACRKAVGEYEAEVNNWASRRGIWQLPIG